MAEPEPHATDAGVFIPFRQPERDTPLPIEEIVSRLGEIGLYGRPLELFETAFRETLLPYDPERQPSLGVASFVDFETFAYVHQVPKGLPMKVWSRLARQSERIAYVRAASDHGAAELRQQHEAAQRIITLSDVVIHAVGERDAARKTQQDITAQLRRIDASVREVSEEYGNGNYLLLQLSDPSLSGEPFMFIDPDCTEPIQGHTGSYRTGVVNRPNVLRSSYIKVDAMYNVIARKKPGEWPNVRGPRYDIVTIPFLNYRISETAGGQ